MLLGNVLTLKISTRKDTLILRTGWFHPICIVLPTIFMNISEKSKLECRNQWQFIFRRYYGFCGRVKLGDIEPLESELLFYICR